MQWTSDKKMTKPEVGSKTLQEGLRPTCSLCTRLSGWRIHFFWTGHLSPFRFRNSPARRSIISYHCLNKCPTNWFPWTRIPCTSFKTDWESEFSSIWPRYIPPQRATETTSHSKTKKSPARSNLIQTGSLAKHIGGRTIPTLYTKSCDTLVQGLPFSVSNAMLRVQ